MGKKVFVMCLLVMLMGCAGKKNNSMFARAGDRLELSTCAKCKGKPFYINGRWVINEKK